MYSTNLSSHKIQICIVADRIFCSNTLDKVLPPRNIQGKSAPILKIIVPIVASVKADPK